MKRLLQLCFMLGAIQFTVAQNLISKIPSDVGAVVTIKGKNLTDLLSLDEIQNSKMGEGILKELKRESDGRLTDLNDVGINLKSDIYYFFQTNDSIKYHAFLLPVKDIEKAKVLFNVKEDMVSNKNGVTIFQKKNRDNLIAWKNNTMLLLMGDYNNSFFYDDEVSERYGLENNDYNKRLNELILENVEEPEEVEEEIVVIEEAVEEEPIEVVISEEEKDRMEEEIQRQESLGKTTTSPYARKREIAANWVSQKAIAILNDSPVNSILKNTDFLSSQDRNAEATFWVNRLDKLYASYLGLNEFSRSGINPEALYENSGFSGKLAFNEEQIVFETSFKMNDEMENFYNNISKAKVNSKFLNYINEDKMLGYMSYAINTEAFLEGYPKLVQDAFGKMMPEYNSVSEIGAELFEIILDEEAIAEVFKGDLLFVVSDIVEKEREYKTYTYDEDFNRVEVTKMKKEPLPEFLMMTSTGKPEMFQKLMRFVQKKEKGIINHNGIYEIDTKGELPLSLFLMIHEDIIFFGTSKVDLANIRLGRFNAKVGSKHKKLIRKNNTTFYVNGEAIMNAIPGDNKQMSYLRSNVKDMVVTTVKGKGNSMRMHLNIPKGHENGLKYLFHLIEELGN